MAFKKDEQNVAFLYSPPISNDDKVFNQLMNDLVVHPISFYVGYDSSSYKDPVFNQLMNASVIREDLDLPRHFDGSFDVCASPPSGASLTHTLDTCRRCDRLVMFVGLESHQLDRGLEVLLPSTIIHS